LGDEWLQSFNFQENYFAGENECKRLCVKDLVRSGTKTGLAGNAIFMTAGIFILNSEPQARNFQHHFSMGTNQAHEP